MRQSYAKTCWISHFYVFIQVKTHFKNLSNTFNKKTFYESKLNQSILSDDIAETRAFFSYLYIEEKQVNNFHFQIAKNL